MADSDDGGNKERARDSGRDRDRSRRGERPSRFSEGSVRDRSGDRGHERGGRKSSNCRVYVSNISYEYRWQDLKDLFRDNVGDVSFVELFVDESDKPKGCGIVEFSDTGSVKKCMEVMHRYDLKGRKLVIKEDFGNERDKHGTIINGGGGGGRRAPRDRHTDKDWDDRDSRRGSGGGGGGNSSKAANWDSSPPSLLSNMMGRSAGPAEPPEFKWGNTYGLSPQFLESLNIHKPLVNRVFVANLDYKVDEKKLREVFKLCGKVADIELYHDKDGNSRGFAVVEFDHPVESVQAISMLHNQMLYERQMTVRMDRVDHDVPLKLPDGLKGVGMGLGVNGEPLRDVSRNLPSTGGSGGNSGAGNGGGAGNGALGPNSGPGILGAVPNAGLQGLTAGLGSALQSVVNAPNALANLTGQSAAALHASLGGGVPAPFLGGGLGAGMANDLGFSGLASSNLNSSLSSLNSSLTQSHALAALGGGGGNSMGGGSAGGGLGNSMGGGMMAGRCVGMANSGRDYGRGDSTASNEYMGGGNGGGGGMGGSGNLGGCGMSSAGNQGGAGNLGGNRDYTTGGRNEYEPSGSMRSYDMMGQDGQDNYRQSSVYSTVNNGSQNRANNSTNAKSMSGYSDTVIVSNLPISATWKMLKEKFSNAGEVVFVEMKSKDTAIIRYSSEWQAERAIKLMDRVRIDGRTLDVRFFY